MWRLFAASGLPGGQGLAGMITSVSDPGSVAEDDERTENAVINCFSSIIILKTRGLGCCLE